VKKFILKVALAVNNRQLEVHYNSSYTSTAGDFEYFLTKLD